LISDWGLRSAPACPKVFCEAGGDFGLQKGTLQVEMFAQVRSNAVHHFIVCFTYSMNETPFIKRRYLMDF
jgi:hypothetical protein